MTLREWMYQERIGTSALARMLDVTPAAVTHWKKRRKVPDDDHIAKLDTITRGQVRREDLLRDPVADFDAPVTTKPIRRRA
jgi:DNA-binding transcriptional regulator YdaS (Cro superfamily)